LVSIVRGGDFPAEQQIKAVGLRPDFSPSGRCRSLPAHMESGQARVHSGVRPLASLTRPLRLQSRQLGSRPLSTFVAQGTSALTATRRRDCGRRSHPQTRSTSRTTGPPAAPVCSRPAPCQRTDARSAGHNGEAVTVGSRQTLHSSPWRSFRSRFSVCQPCWFNPSQPPKGGAITPGLP